MKIPSCFPLIVLTVATVAHAQVSTAASASAADAAWAELQSLGLHAFKSPDNAGQMSQRERSEWFEQRARRLRELGTAFIAASPPGPRRWTVVSRMIESPPQFIRSYGPNYEKDYKDVVVDETAAAAWKAKLAELERALRAAPDLPADVREALDQSDLSQTIFDALRSDAVGREPDWASLTRKILDFAARYPASSAASQMGARGAMYRFEASHPPAQSAAQWREFLATPNEALAAMAREKVRALEAISGELKLAFTAVDGRTVDLKKLRGKVVLIDFWATWCGPCMAEMPNVRKVYAAYHDQGFEIVGISCDIAPSPELTGAKAKMARTAAQLIEFKAQNGMPWPDYYDGKKHNEGGNALAARFAVTGIPASFLLDQTGRVVALNLRGEKLEAEVKRLLKL